MITTPTQASILNLPSVAQVKELVENSLTHDWILRIEHIGPDGGETVRTQWRQWGDSLYAVRDASSVIDSIVACRSSNPKHAIRLNAEKVNPRTQMFYPVYRPQQHGEEARVLQQVGAVPSLVNDWVSSLGNGARAMRGLAWKVATVVGMLLVSLLMLEEVLA
jgi:ribulose bisphosphate carboxylase small subunit